MCLRDRGAEAYNLHSETTMGSRRLNENIVNHPPVFVGINIQSTGKYSQLFLGIRAP